MLNIVRLNNNNTKSKECENIIKTLPEWFGIPEANQKYTQGIKNTDVFTAEINNKVVGMIALKQPTPKTIDIWWMGIYPDFHRQNIGKALIQQTILMAQENKCDHIVVETLSDESDDDNYKKTRLFYEAMGFYPLIKHGYNGPENPMVYMLKSL